jgi:hypothetical protein
LLHAVRYYAQISPLLKSVIPFQGINYKLVLVNNYTVLSIFCNTKLVVYIKKGSISIYLCITTIGGLIR